MTRTFKALSALLSYPTPELQAAARDLRDAIAGEGIVDGVRCRALDRLIDEIAESDVYDLQERYVLLFDRTRSLSLHLFEHVHGESRDRGQAMIDLEELYAKSGLAISATELPDYLPLFLEFLSTRPFAEARDLLGQTAHILDALAERLEKRGSPYAAVFALAGLHRPGGGCRSRSGAAAGRGGRRSGRSRRPRRGLGGQAGVVRPRGDVRAASDDLIARLRAAKRPAAGGADRRRSVPWLTSSTTPSSAGIPISA